MAKRRAAGEGSIFQLPDSRWSADIDLGYETGKRKRKRVQTKTQAEVIKKRNEILMP